MFEQVTYKAEQVPTELIICNRAGM